jgi:hypothetical protein
VFLIQLEEAVGQAWLDGAKSVVNWRINDAANCLPLWIITFWREAERLNRIQSMWKQSMKWLSYEEAWGWRNGKLAIPIQSACELLGSLQWNGKMDYCNKTTSTPQLSHFIGTFWLSDDHINMLVEEILVTSITPHWTSMDSERDFGNGLNHYPHFTSFPFPISSCVLSQLLIHNLPSLLPYPHIVTAASTAELLPSINT